METLEWSWEGVNDDYRFTVYQVTIIWIVLQEKRTSICTLALVLTVVDVS